MGKNQKNHNDIILCQPDSKKGCSACCGLFNNADISKKNLSKFLRSFEERKKISGKTNCYWNEKTEYSETRCDIAHICPYQGFINKGKPGCMYHPLVNGKCMRKKSLFGTRICNSYLCPAHDILDRDIKRILIKYVDDWYLYTVAVIDPDSFIWIVDILRDSFGLDFTDSGAAGLKRKALCRALKIHAEYLNNLDMPVFYYSRSEYNGSKALFSLGSKRRERKEERQRIMRELKGML